MITEESIAIICHDANRAYCRSLGDESQMPWDEAPQWQRESAIKGVQLHLTREVGAHASHESWCKEKYESGWKYGPVKNPDKKEHPCLVPFHELPRDQQMKDHLFKAIVETFKVHG